mgnify:CR=1 FL=1
MPIEVFHVEGPANYANSEKDIQRVAAEIKGVHEQVSKQKGDVVAHYVINLAMGGRQAGPGIDQLFIVADLPK